MKQIEISPIEATLIQQALLALQREVNSSVDIPSLTQNEWLDRYNNMVLMDGVHKLSLKVSAPFVTTAF